MAALTRRAICVVAVLLGTALAQGPADADEVVRCWYESGGNLGGGSQRLICRIVGSEAVVVYEQLEPPPPLYPAVGDDGDGTCWYNRTVATNWRIVGTRGDGSAYMWYAPDTRWIDVGWVRRCSSEPTEITTPLDLVWETVAAFDFEVPEATLQPEDGVTGLPTYAVVDPPRPVIESLTAPVTGTLVEVEFTVASVILDWGDGEPEPISPLVYDLFGPHPDGEITHTYETKDLYSTSVTYDWKVRWRVDGGPWDTVNGIEPTVWTGPYQVDEIVTRVTG